LAAHALLVRLRLTGIFPYLVTAALIGGSWCIVMTLSAVGWAYVVPCALVGTATFWAIRRPDRLAGNHTAAGTRAA
jgi:cell division protein FtsW (lipid II flippase)